jgi:hypothetical protein
LAVDFLAADLRFAGARLAAVLRFAVDFFAADFFAAVLRFAVVFLFADDRALERDEDRVRAGTARGACSSSGCPASEPLIDHSVGAPASGDSLAAPVPLQSSWVIYDLLGLSCVDDPYHVGF